MRTAESNDDRAVVTVFALAWIDELVLEPMFEGWLELPAEYRRITVHHPQHGHSSLWVYAQDVASAIFPEAPEAVEVEARA